MATDWLKIILEIAPKANRAIARGLADAMPIIVRDWGVSTALDQAHFLAQTAHESDGFRTTVEYASGDAYDTRTDLGFTTARDGDGRKYKGFGLIQSTGPKNQRAAAKALGILSEWLKNPRVMAEFPWAALSAAYYWKTHGLSAIANGDDVEAVTRRVNGGLNGFADRKTYLARAKKALAVFGENVAPATAGPDPLPRAKVKSLQAALSPVYPLGKADGQVGPKSTKAISAFQFGNGIPVTGTFDSATVEAIEAGVKVPAERVGSKEKPEGSRILKNARSLKVTAAALAAPAAAKLLDDPLTYLEGASGYWQRAKSLAEPFGGLPGLIGDHWPIAIIALCFGLFVIAHRIAQARVEDYRTGKTA